MFKSIISLLRDLISVLSLLRLEISKFSLNNCFHYYVEYSYEDSKCVSSPLNTLEEVNHFIEFVVLVRKPLSITIVKKFDC